MSSTFGNMILIVVASSVVAYAGSIHAGQSFGMMRNVIEPNASVQESVPWVIDDDGFKVVQCYPEENGTLLKCDRPTDEKVGLAFWEGVLGREFTRWAPTPEGVGCLCYVRDLKKQYVNGQTMDCGVFTYYGTETFRCGDGQTLTVRGFKPASDEVVRLVRSSLSERREKERKRADEEAEKARKERAMEKKIAYREGEIRHELAALHKEWEAKNKASLERETYEALDRERVSLRFPASVHMPALCGLKLGMSRGDVHEVLGISVELAETERTYPWARRNILIEDLVVMEARKLKKTFSVFDSAILTYHDPYRNIQLSVLKRFALVGRVDLDRFSLKSCRQEYARVRTLLEDKLQVKFDRVTEDSSYQRTYCRAPFGTYKNKSGFGENNLAYIELLMERERDGNFERFSVVVDGYEKIGCLLNDADRLAQKLMAEKQDERKESLRPSGSENEAFN